MMIIFAIWVTFLAAVSSYAQVPSSLVQLGNGIYYSKYAFVVDKEQRQLSIWENRDGELVQLKAFLADMGKSEGEKVKEGDHKTPEGVYFFIEKLSGKSIPFELYGSRAFTTNYPNYFDKRAGKTGSGIWLHAVPDSTPLTRGSRGCVVIRNQAVLQVESFFTPHTTPIVIEKQPKYSSNQQMNQQREIIEKFISSWLDSWHSEDINEYMNHYHPLFRGKGMNRNGWKRYKSRIKKYQSNVAIEISKPIILFSENQVTIRFLQSFKSDQLADFGEKTLYLIENEGQLSIFGEHWRAAKSDLAKNAWSKHPFVRPKFEASTQTSSR